MQNQTKYPIRFRGTAMIPKLNQFAPCRVELNITAIESILETLYRRPMFLEMYYVDPSDREWELTYSNFRKILPTTNSTPTPTPTETHVENNNPSPNITTYEESTPQEEPTEEDDDIVEDEYDESTEETDYSETQPNEHQPTYNQQHYHSNNKNKHRRK